MDDFDTLKAQKDAILADKLRRCAICGFIIDLSYAAEKPSIDFTTRGRAKHTPETSVSLINAAIQFLRCESLASINVDGRLMTRDEVAASLAPLESNREVGAG